MEHEFDRMEKSITEQMVLQKEFPDEDHENGECDHPSEQDELVARNSLMNQPHDRLTHGQYVFYVQVFGADAIQ